MKTEVFSCKSDMHVRPMQAFCALQLTVLIKPKWYVLLYCCACLHPNTILMETGWTTVPCPTTNLSILICARTKQRVISVALKTLLEIRLVISIYKTSLLHRPEDCIGFAPSCPPHFTTKLRSWVCRILTASWGRRALNPGNWQA